jgi:hypothetical protein
MEKIVSQTPESLEETRKVEEQIIVSLASEVKALKDRVERLEKTYGIEHI